MIPICYKVWIWYLRCGIHIDALPVVSSGIEAAHLRFPQTVPGDHAGRVAQTGHAMGVGATHFTPTWLVVAAGLVLVLRQHTWTGSHVESLQFNNTRVNTLPEIKRMASKPDLLFSNVLVAPFDLHLAQILLLRTERLAKQIQNQDYFLTQALIFFLTWVL